VLGTTKFDGVPDIVVTVPLPNVVDRKSNESADAEMVSALAEADAEIENIFENAFANVTFWLASMLIAVVPAVCRARTPEASAVATRPPEPEFDALSVVVMG